LARPHLARERSQTIKRALAVSLLVGCTLLTIATSAMAEKTYRIGMLEMTSAAANAANLNALTDGLRPLGYEVGRNLVIYYRSAERDPRRFPDLAAELAAADVDIIVTRHIVAAASALKVVPGKPIVMPGAGDLVAFGLAKSLARPGGLVTGFTEVATPLSATRLQLIKEAFPGIRRVGTLVEPSTAANPERPTARKATSGRVRKTKARAAAAPVARAVTAEAAVPSFGFNVGVLRVSKSDDLNAALQASARRRDEALLVGGGAVLQSNIARIVEFVAKQRIPAVYALPEFVEAGGLMAYAVSLPDLYRRAGAYVDRIFKGARPGDLPIEPPTQYQLVVNLRAAYALDLSLPEELVARAERVIE
jgi:putative ABC transport system substrate-binding protein